LPAGGTPGVSQEQQGRPAEPAPAARVTAALSKAAIFRAIPGGSRRCRGQREWLAAALAAIEAESWYANRKAHYAAIARQLMLHMDWRARTTRPGHDRIAAAAGVSTDTVARAVAWLGERGLLGVVSPGSTPLLRPYALLRGDEGNLAVVYVLTVPRKRSSPPPPADVGLNEFADLSGPRSGPDKALRTREPGDTPPPQKARAPRGGSLLPRAGDYPRHAHPQTRTEALAAAGAVRTQARTLRPLSDQHVRHLARVFFAAGWSPADVLHALDHDPADRPYGYTADVRSPAAWARHRLAAWLTPGTAAPLPSRDQLAAQQRAAAAAEQARRRAAPAPGTTSDYLSQAARARAMLAQALGRRPRSQLQPE
jgi:hypothetical protein